MSLINQMLKDLEARRGREADPFGNVRPLPEPRTGARATPAWLVLGTATATLALVAAGVWFYGYLTAEPPPPAAPSTTLPAVPAEPLVYASPAADEAVTEEDAAAGEPLPAPSLAEATEAPPSRLAVAAGVGTDRTAPSAASDDEEMPQGAEQPATAAPSARVAAEPSPAGVFEKRPVTTTPAEEAERAYQDALQALAAGRPLRAEERLRAALLVHPPHLAARETLLALLLRQGRTAEAETLARDGAALGGEARRFAKTYADLLFRRGELARAREALEADPPPLAADPDYHALRAGLAQRAGDAERAAALYGALVAHDPARALWWTGLAIAEDQRGRAAEALAAFRRAQALGLAPDVQSYVADRIRALENRDAAAGAR